jgi:inhibitor of cysteine peptidase
MSDDNAPRLGGRALAGETPGRRPVLLTEADTRHPIVVHRGDTVELHLPEAPETDYLWRWRMPEGLRMMCDERLPAGQRRLAFAVYAAGRHELRVELARPWESEPRQALTFTLHAQSLSHSGEPGARPTQLGGVERCT